MAARENRCDVDNAVNTLQSLREIPSNEVIDDNDIYEISVLGVRSLHGGGSA